MKKFLLTCLVLFSTAILSAQGEQQEKLSKQRYLSAYNYILSDSVAIESTVHVMNDTTNVYLARYINQLDKYPIEKEVALADYKNYEIFSKPFSRYSSTLAELSLLKNYKADLVLVFSGLKCNMMEASIVNNRLKNQEQKTLYILDMQSLTKPYTPFTPHNIMSYTEGYIYLFLFDNNSTTIKDVFRSGVIYN